MCKLRFTRASCGSTTPLDTVTYQTLDSQNAMIQWCARLPALLKHMCALHWSVYREPTKETCHLVREEWEEECKQRVKVRADYATEMKKVLSPMTEEE